MDNEHDDILNDLINYYDSAEDESDEHTTVIPPVKPTSPPEETFGDTVVVNVKPQSVSNVDKTDSEETTVLNIPKADKPEIPRDEVLGNLDTDGRSTSQSPRQHANLQNNTDTLSVPLRQRTPEVPPKRKTGIWYALKPLWTTIIVCMLLVASYLFYVTDTGIIGIYKSNFSYNFSLIMRIFGVEVDNSTDLPITDNNPFITTAYAEGEEIFYDTAERKVSVPFTGADSASFENFDNGVVCVKSNYICYLNTNGEKKWEYDTQISNPLLSVSGKYIAVAGKDSTHLNLYKGRKLLYSVDVSDKIKYCSVSEKGDVALVTDKTAYKGSVTVFNKKGEEVFSWISGVNYITAVTMLNSRNVAVSLVSTENNVKSYVMLFDIYDKDPINGAELTNSLIFGSKPHKNNAYICADNSISSVNSDGELNYLINFDNMDITHAASDKKGWRAVSYIDGYLPYINIYNRKGDVYAFTQTEAVPDCIDLYKSVILYNDGRDVFCGLIDDVKTRYAAPMTVRNLIMVNKNTYMIVYENSLEIIKI